jgi:hypothetical protein
MWTAFQAWEGSSVPENFNPKTNFVTRTTTFLKIVPVTKSSLSITPLLNCNYWEGGELLPH